MKKSASMRPSRAKSLDRRRFRQLMLESLEGRALLAGIDVPVDSWHGADFVNNEVMVRFNSNVTREQATNELFMRGGATIKQWFPELNLAQVRLATPYAVQSAQIDAIEGIHNWTSVYYAEPNFIRELRRTPNDPGFGQQWAHQNTGQAVNPAPPPGLPGLLPGVPDADTDATNAWDVVVGSPNTVIAIIDTGVDYRHPDLAANAWRNPREAPDGIDNDGNGFIDDIFGWDFADGDSDPDDTDGHGTHVAGIAAAVGNNGLGVAGVNWNSKIMAIRAGNPGFSTSAITGAQLYIAKMRSQYGINIVVSNNSYGLSGGPFSQVEFDGITVASNAGIPFVAAAGNSAVNNDTIPDYPSNYLVNGLISVASTDNNDVLSAFSQYGLTTVDLAAPGEQILSTVPPFFNPPFLYDYFDGTSMAAPMVAGAVGLLRSFDSSLSVTQVKDLILQGVDRIPNLATRVLTGGRLNIAKSLDLIPRNEIRGTVFEDVNANASFDGTEGGLSGWTVYLDLNNNGVFNTTEPSALTAANGAYFLRGLFGPGTFNVRTVIQPAFRQTFPVLSGAQSITLPSRTATVAGVNFGVHALPGEIHGRKWNDLDGDGVMDAGEPGIQGVVIYVDLNDDAKIGVGEPGAITDGSGNYTILNVAPGLYNVREVYQPGFIQIFPDPQSTSLGAHLDVAVTRGTITSNINFGNQAAFDYGDAPNDAASRRYPTLISQNGAVHGLLQGFRLGATVDAESNGQPTVGADGDDFAGNEVQRISIGASTLFGTFRLSFAGQTTSAIPFDADAAAVRSALEALPNIGAGRVLVTGGPGPATPWVVTFRSTLANKNLAQMTGSGSFFPAGSVTVVTQQNGGADDEDGIVIGNLVPNQPGSVIVTANTGSFAAGYLQGWVDFNRDGDWNDANEKVFTDVQLTTGTFTLTFPVPSEQAGTLRGPTYARFRYSLEHGVGPTGTALGGEVEDYRINVLGIAPTAIDDPSIPGDPLFTVDDNPFGSNLPTPLNVLLNDLPSSTGPAGIDPASAPTSGDQGGTVSIDDNGTPTDRTDDVFLYTAPVGFVGIDTFTYRAVDPAGHVSDEATVSVTVRFVPRDPIAIDNTFDVARDSLAAANKLDVMANDVPGAGGASRFLTQTPPSALHGTVTYDTNGGTPSLTDDFYRYQPNAGYEGADSFTYTIVDPLNNTSTATVSIQVLAAPRTPFSGAIIQFELQVVDKVTGSPLPDGALIPLGTSILVRGIVTDLRGSVIDPSQNIEFVGAFSAYMDLLYDRVKVQPVGPITYGPQYQDAKSGFGGTPGLIDEIGSAFSDLSVNNPGPSAKRVFTKEFRTTATGVLQFVADPADSSPAHDITAFVIDNGNPLNSKVQKIPTDQIYYRASFPNISIIGAGEGENTNLLVPTDVNLDGRVSPLDALLVINYINDNFVADSAAGGEDSPDNWKRDVNHDNLISPIDALLVINYLNRQSAAIPVGEAEGEADIAPPSSPLSISVSKQSASESTASNSDAGATAATMYAAAVDRVFGQTDWTRPAVNRSEDAGYSAQLSGSEDFFTSLESGNNRRLRKSL